MIVKVGGTVRLYKKEVKITMDKMGYLVQGKNRVLEIVISKGDYGLMWLPWF